MRASSYHPSRCLNGIIALVLLFLLVAVDLPVAAQTPEGGKHISFSHGLRSADERLPRRTNAALQPDTLRVLAIMVEFQPDNDSRTTGPGTFDLSIPTKRLVDPPPHNEQYFQHHMTFAQNYFRKVSDGKFHIEATVMSQVFRLANPMQRYSPSRSSTTNIELGRMMQEAWHMVDSTNPGFPFSSYDAFIIFHAGVGRDLSVDLFDRTPFDIPSLYIGQAALKKMFGNDYGGIPVSGGTFNITNSMIIPETESRPEETIDGGTVLLQLGINGLIVASIGSHIGLPDLFDTKTGRTAIGRFGLMDGQSIFSWRGIFPPEPMAWEKQFLGWVNPITITRDSNMYRLPAVTLSNQSDTIYRVLISEKEYFLVENRNRDANRDSMKVTLAYNGETIVKAFARDTNRLFNAFDIDSLYGVVIDVDEFDVSLPGGVLRETGELLDGGILIWHIDENVIDAKYAIAEVNADMNRRGIDLEEADGAQDLGQQYDLLQPGFNRQDGHPFDFWFGGHPELIRRLSNEFSATSNPSSLSNDLANSHVTIKDFSPRAPVMTVRIKVGDEQVQMLAGFPKEIEGRPGTNSVFLSPPTVGGEPALFVATDAMYGWRLDGNSLDGFSSNGKLVERTYPGIVNWSQPVIGDFDGDSFMDIAAVGVVDPDVDAQSALYAWELQDNNGDDFADPLFLTMLPPNYPGTTRSITLRDSLIAVPIESPISVPIDPPLHPRSSMVTLVSTSGILLRTVTSGLAPNFVAADPWGFGFLALSNNELFTIISDTTIIIEEFFLHPSQPFVGPFVASPVSGNFSTRLGNYVVVAAASGWVYLIGPGQNESANSSINTFHPIKNSPAIADIDADGQKDIIVFSGNKIWAINAVGSVLDNFPITVNTDSTLLTSPIVADIDADGDVDIVAVTQEGLIVAYDYRGRMAHGFPLLSGPNGGSTPAAFLTTPPACLECPYTVNLAIASDDGHVYAWQTGTSSSRANPPALPWPQFMHDAQNTGLDESTVTGTPRTQEFLPANLAYNWPNPVGPEHDFKTRIRYYLAQDAKVHIRIFDLAGDLVTEFDAAGRGGLDNEIEWDVKNIQSGIYFAHIDAEGTGQSANVVIKIAVVK